MTTGFRRFIFLVIVTATVWALAKHWGPGYLLMTATGDRVVTSIASLKNHVQTVSDSLDSGATIRRLDETVSQLRSENRDLALKLQTQADLAIRNARIVGYHPLDSWQVAIINRGSQAGVSLGQIGIDGKGNLAGRIVQVRPTTSDLLLITNPQETIDVRIGEAGYRALLSGHFQSFQINRGLWLTQAEFIDQQSPIKPGDSVVTSGINGRYPAGLRIGAITDIKKDDLHLFQTGTVIPAIDFSLLQDVYLLIPSS